MANWNSPTLASSYSSFLSTLKGRDEDAATMFVSNPSNPKPGFMRYVRSGNKFQEYRSNAWRDEVLSLSAGGTGVSTLTALQALIGGGGDAVNLSNITITGGTIAGIGSLGVNGNATIGGRLITGSDSINLTNDDGRIPSLHSNYFASLDGSNLTSLMSSQIPNLSADKITSDSFHTNRIPNLPASRITSGSFNTGRIPDLSADKITSNTFNTSRIPNLPAGKITSDTFHSDRIPSIPRSRISDAGSAIDYDVWVGTQSSYNNISNPSNSTIYFRTS